jgi:hypothetical protein
MEKVINNITAKNIITFINNAMKKGFLVETGIDSEYSSKDLSISIYKDDYNVVCIYLDSKKDIVVYPGSHSDSIKITNLSSSDIKAFESVILEANKYSKNITLRYLNNFFNNPNIRKV